MHYQQMFEKAKRAAPALTEPDFLILLEEGQRKFCDRTHILEDQWTLQTVGNLLHDLDPACIAVTQADYNGKLMNKFGGDRNNIELQV